MGTAQIKARTRSWRQVGGDTGGVAADVAQNRVTAADLGIELLPITRPPALPDPHEACEKNDRVDGVVVQVRVGHALPPCDAGRESKVGMTRDDEKCERLIRPNIAGDVDADDDADVCTATTPTCGLGRWT